MKTKIFLLLLLLLNISNAQSDVALGPAKTDTSILKHKITSLEYFLNSQDNLNENQIVNLINKSNSQEIKNLADKNSMINAQKVSIEIKEFITDSVNAKVFCEFVFYNDSIASEPVSDVIEFKKQKDWGITDLGILRDLFSAKYQQKKEESVPDNPLANQAVFLSTSTFIKKYAHSGINEYQLDKGLAQSELQRELFGSSQGIDNTYFATQTTETAFWLDQSWKRIVFSKNDPNTLNIYSYGDHTGNFHFSTPRSIDANDWGELYIADSESKVVNKLYYSAITNTITALSNVNFIQGLQKPVDVDYYQGSTLGNRSDDIIIVADEEDNSLPIYNYDGSFICKLTGYYDNGVKNISRPKRVAVFGYEQPYRVAFIDGGTNSLVVVRLPENFNNWTGWLYVTSPPVKFDLPSHLTDIGIDGCYNILVPDRAKNMIHKFNKDGKYACSYSGGNDFTIPYYVTNIPDNCPYPEMVWVDLALASSWETDNGMRRYLPGADISFIENTDMNSYFRLRFVPTDDIAYNIQVIRVQDNVVVKSYNGFAYTSVQKDIILNINELPTANTNYKWKFSCIPIYNDQYGQWAVSWKVTEINFYYNIVSPVISGFTQNPKPLCPDWPANVTCNLSQGNRNITYNWSYTHKPSYIRVTIIGNTAHLIHQGILPLKEKIYSEKGEFPMEEDFELHCTATNSAGSSLTVDFTPSISNDCYNINDIRSWAGDINLNNNVTIGTNGIVIIDAGTKIRASNNIAINSNGIVRAIGQLGNKITFDRIGTNGTWGSITFSGSASSSSVLDNVEINNGTGIKLFNGANVTIRNSLIQNCTEGIYFYNSSPSIINNQIIEPVQNGINGEASGMSVEILHNTIRKTIGNPKYRQYQGIILSNNTNGYIAHNDISGFSWGMYIGGGSDAYFTNLSYQSFSPNNRIKDNSIGLGAGWGAFVRAGIWKSFDRNNSIYDNPTYDARSYQSSTVYAQNNWWGNDGAQISVDGTSTLDASLPLTSNPWGGLPNKGSFILVNNNPAENGGNPEDSILTGLELEIEGRIPEAVLHYKSMIGNNSFAGFALGRIVALKQRFNLQNIRTYLDSLLTVNRPYKPIVLTYLAGILLNEDRYNLAMLMYNRIMNEYPETYYFVNALFGKFFASLNYANNRALAGQLLQELESLNLEDEEYLMRLTTAQYLYNESSIEYLGKPVNQNLVESQTEVPKEYSLLGNYPNPFNPSTTISYSLPYYSDVELIIYDIMGREIKLFYNIQQASGYQKIVWDGTNKDGVSVASGVYLYRIKIKSLENDETFVKSSKLLMLK